MTNKDFSQEDVSFKKACIVANCKITTRQASKFQQGKGIAWKVITGRSSWLKKGNPGYEEHATT